METPKPKTNRLSINGKKNRSNDSPKTPLSSKKSLSTESPSTPKSIKFNVNLINNTTECDHSPSNDDYFTASQSAMSNYRDVIWKWNDDGHGSSKTSINQSTPPLFKRKQRDLITPTLLQQIEPKIDKTKGFYKFQKLLLGEGANVKNLISSFNNENHSEKCEPLEATNNQESFKNLENDFTAIDETSIEFHFDSTINENFQSKEVDVIISSDEDDLNSAVVVSDEALSDEFDKYDSLLANVQEQPSNQTNVNQNLSKFNSSSKIEKQTAAVKVKFDDDMLNLLDDSECDLLAECSQVVESSLNKILNPRPSESVKAINSTETNDKRILKDEKAIHNIPIVTNENDWFGDSYLEFDSEFKTQVQTTEVKLEQTSKNQYTTNQVLCNTNLNQQKSQFSRHKSMPSPILLTNKRAATNNKNFSRLPSSDCIPLDFNSLANGLKITTNSSSSVGSAFSDKSMSALTEFSEIDEGKRRLIKEELERKKIEAQNRLRRKQLAKQQKEAWALKNAQKLLPKKNSY